MRMPCLVADHEALRSEAWSLVNYCTEYSESSKHDCPAYIIRYIPSIGPERTKQTYGTNHSWAMHAILLLNRVHFR